MKKEEIIDNVLGRFEDDERYSEAAEELENSLDEIWSWFEEIRSMLEIGGIDELHRVEDAKNKAEECCQNL